MWDNTRISVKVIPTAQYSPFVCCSTSTGYLIITSCILGLSWVCYIILRFTIGYALLKWECVEFTVRLQGYTKHFVALWCVVKNRSQWILAKFNSFRHNEIDMKYCAATEDSSCGIWYIAFIIHSHTAYIRIHDT